MMGDVSILTPDGKKDILSLYRIDKNHKWEGQCYRSIMGVSTLHLRIECNEPIEFPLGCHIEEEGYRYTLYYPSSIIKRHTKSFEYQLLFHGVEEELKLYKLKDVSGGKPYRLKFFLTAKPIDFLRVIVDTLNLSDGGWSVGDCIEAGEKTLAFHHEDCLSVLSRVAEEFNTEWHIEGRRVSLGKVSHFQDDPLPMQYGMGNGFRSGVGRRNNADKQPIGKLYVEGGSRNIDRSKYGSPTLLLPKSTTLIYKGKQYRTDSEGMYITCEGNNYPAEDSFDGSNVYPMREGTVSEVVEVKEGEQTFYDIKDSSIPESLNYNDYRIAGERATIVFQTGALAGREFDLVQTETELTGYIHSERRFKIVPAEIDGFTMPSGTFIPAVGDKYAIFNISLPQEYLSSASQKMLEEAVEYFHQHSEPSFIFDGEVDPIWARKHWLEVGGKLIVGSHILFSDPQFHPEGSVIRINGVMNQLGEPYHIELTLTNAPSAGSLANTLSKLEAEPLLAEKRDRELQRSQRQSYEQALEHIGMVERAVEGVEGFSKRIKPSVIETMGILVGSQATQLDFVERYGSLKSVPMAINYNPSDKRITISNAFIRHQTIGITSISNARKPTDYRYWSVARYTSPALTDMEQSYYIYAKVEREGKGGNYLLSPDPLPFETTTHYHLLIGTLSSVIDGDRAYNRLYGFSMVTPGQILTDTISSANGNMTIDLQNGSIISDQIEFRRPDGSTKSVEEVITDTVQVGGRNLLLKSNEGTSNNNYLVGRCNISDPSMMIAGETYTIQIWGEAEGIDFSEALWIYNSDGNTDVASIQKRVNGVWKQTFKWRDDQNKSNSSLVIFRGANHKNYKKGSKTSITRIKLEKGSIATDWSPAPEDIQAELDKEAKAREEGDKALSDSTQTLQQALDALRESGANDNATLTDLINKANQRLDNLQEQADGEVSNWFYPGAPAQDKAPENEWMTNGLKARHIGDTYTSTDESGQFMGKSWRYTTEFKWQEIHDTLVSQALAQASKAQTTADGKSTTFLVKPTKYEEGDTWVMESSQVLNGISYEAGTMLFAKQGSSAFVESHWVDKVRYIGATQLKESEEASKRAWEAYANEQAEAERVKAEAHADGIVTAEEQARIEATNKALETAKAYAEAQDKLLEQRQKAYADGVLTEAEKRAIEVAEKEAKLAETNAKAYSDGVLTEAEKKAIAQAQKAYNDAVAKAKELDGQIQVGGRNLLKLGLQPPVDSGSEIEEVEAYTYKVQARNSSYPRLIIKVEDHLKVRKGEDYVLTLDVKGKTIHKEGNGVSLRVANVNSSNQLADLRFYPIDEANYIRLVYPFKAQQDSLESSLIQVFLSSIYPQTDSTSLVYVRNVKLERGTVATDWSPAPEDVQAEIDAINANPPRINQATKNWEVYVPSQGKYVDTGRTSVGDDGKAPKIVDGYWYEWDSSTAQYTNTGIKARGPKGDGLDVKDTRNDNQPPRWYRQNYRNTTVKELKIQSVIEIPTSWRDGGFCTLETTVRWSDTTGGRVTQKATLNSGLELYRNGTADDSAWGAWSNTKAEVQAIQRGLSNANTLIATLEKTAKELKEGKLDTKDLPDLQYLLNALQKGDTKIAGGLVLSKIIALSNQVDRITAYLSGYDGTSGDGKILRAGIQYTKTKEDVKPIRSFLTDYCGYKNVEAIPHVNNVITKEALFTWLRQQKEPFEKFYKALSGGTLSFNPSINSSKIDLSKTNAIIYSHYDGNSEAVAIRHDGTGHFGDIHLNGDRIDYQETQDANPYLTVGRGTYSTIEEVIRKNDYRAYNPSNIADKSFDYNPDWNTGDEQVSSVEIKVANDNTKVTITVELMRVDTRIYVKNPDKPGWVHTELQAKLNGHHIKGVMEMYNYGYMHEMPAHPEYSSEHWDSNRDPGIPTDKTGRREWRLVEGNKSSRSVEHSVILPKGTHQLQFIFRQDASSPQHQLPAYASVQGVKVLQEYKTDFKQALISPTGARFYGGRDRYFDINYNAYSNAPTAQLTGGLKVDYIDMPGVPLCGAMVKSDGGVLKSFGKYKNKRGSGRPQVDWSWNSYSYTVHHSIGHTNYISLLTVGNHLWSDQANWSDIGPYSFTVTITNGNNEKNQQDFTFVCFKTD